MNRKLRFLPGGLGSSLAALVVLRLMGVEDNGLYFAASSVAWSVVGVASIDGDGAGK